MSSQKPINTAYDSQKTPTHPHIALIEGDGIGPDISKATMKVLGELWPELTYKSYLAGMTAYEKTGELLPEETLAAIASSDACLKGPITTPVGEGFRSMNVTLRQKFDLYCNHRPIVSYPGTKSRYENLNMITIRENTEGLYCGAGQVVNDETGVAESKSIVTRKGSERIVRYAMEMARRLGRKKVTLVHKANILKSTSGLFLKVGREVAAQFPDIEFNEMIVDNCCMQLVMNPNQFDVIVTTNLFGDILSDLCAGLVGGLGMAPGANIGENAAIFEAVHGSAPDIAGKNIANPIALMLASAMMLEHLGRVDLAHRLRNGLQRLMSADHAKTYLTPDLGGRGSTDSLTDELVKILRQF